MDNIKKVNAMSQVESDIVKDFHNKRLLFIIIDGEVFVEKTPSGMSHIDWIKTLDVNNDNNFNADYILNNFVRGYYYNNAIVFYIGENFEVNNLVIYSLNKPLQSIVDILNINDSTEVGLGCIPVKNTIFKPKYNIGNIGDVFNKDLKYLYKLINK